MIVYMNDYGSIDKKETSLKLYLSSFDSFPFIDMNNILVDIVLVIGLITHTGKKINIFCKIDCGMETVVSTLFVKHLDISLT
jgi:hypothetical protein